VGKRHIIQVMDVISSCKDPLKAALYSSMVQKYLARLIALALVKEKGPPGLFIAEVLLKWIQREGGDGFGRQRRELQQFIEEASGYEENRQRRKRIMEQMEADREKALLLMTAIGVHLWFSIRFCGRRAGRGQPMRTAGRSLQSI
jgi:hypothetical protein